MRRLTKEQAINKELCAQNLDTAAKKLKEAAEEIQRLETKIECLTVIRI